MSSPVRPSGRFAENLFSYAILLGGLAAVVVAARVVISAYTPLFFWDSWEMVLAAARGVDLLSWHWLWQQHNEHRMILPKLLEIADLRWFQGRQASLLVSIFAVQCLHLGVLGWSMRALGGWRGPAWRTGFGLAAFCLFCLSQWENLVWGFQLCFLLPLMLATVSFAGLLLCWGRQSQRPGAATWPFLALSVAAALGANWSLANGVLLWPLLVVASLMLGLRRSAAVTYAAVGSVSSWLYFHALVRRSEVGDPVQALRSPLALLHYVATYLGSAWVTSNVRAATVLGAAGLVAAAVVLLRSRRYLQKFQAFSMQMVLTLLFCLGTALLTSLGRLNLGLAQAFAPRYQSVVLLFWFALGVLIVLPLFDVSQPRLAAILAQLFLLAIFLHGALLAPRPLHDVKYRQFIIDRAEAALLMNVNDPEALRYVYPRADMAWDGAEYLRARHLSIFSDGIEPATPLNSRFAVAPESECTGAVDSTVQVGSGQDGVVKISGWAWDKKHRRPPLTVLAASNGLISGRFGVGAWLPSVRASHPGMNNSYIGFTGYVRESPAPVTIYAVLGGGTLSACPIAEVATSGGR